MTKCKDCTRKCGYWCARYIVMMDSEAFFEWWGKTSPPSWRKEVLG